MVLSPELSSVGALSDGDWLSRQVRRRPELPYVVPFFVFLLLMSLESVLPDRSWKLPAYGLRSVFGLAAVYVFRRHYPPWGRLHPVKCLVFGLLAAVGWVVIHRLVAGQFVDGQWVRPRLSWYVQPLGVDAAPDEYFDPQAVYGGGVLYWLYLVVRIGGATVTVPVVEELFWRGFLLRALVDWERFERVPLGRFTWFSFLVCSLLSAAEHPMWEVGILCWMLYNGLFYWTRSLTCLMVTHGITNFALYVHVVVNKDWVFWS